MAFHTSGTASPRNSDTTRAPSLDDYEIKARPKRDSEIVDEGGVNVFRAEAEFAELSHQLTEVSTSTGLPSDKEKQEDDEPDLLSYLRGYSQERQAHGFVQKQLGVIFSNLSVTGMGGIRLTIRTFPDAVKEFFFFPVIAVMKSFMKKTPKPILSGFNGFVRPGEMCFVLGRPNAGCSTFLKVIANQRIGFMSVEGDIEYGGIDAETMAKRYKGELVYNPEDDVHHATLTVGQTLDFALSTKTPAKRLPSQSKKEFKNQVLDCLLRMLGISHTKDTFVGSADVRGVSGGERKRVSIAEMMTTRACLQCWENSTRGLDASTALQYAKSLRIVANIFKTTMFVTLYQAGEGIYEQFDKVCLLNEGRQVYFGPASQARQYMINLGYKNLPRQTTADYLTGCTDPNERQFSDGADPDTVPKTPEEMEQAYLSSEIYQKMQADMKVYRAQVQSEKQVREDFFKAVREDRHRGVSKKSPRTVSFFNQLRALIKREIQLQLQDRLDLMFAWVTTLAGSIIVGSLFFNLPTTSDGAFIRGGFIFLSMLFNVFISFTELPNQMTARPVMWRQTSFCFYRPGALAMAKTLADIPFSAPRIFVFSGYFMVGLVSNASAFFTYFLLLYSTYLALSSFFRFLGAISFNYDTASRLASVLMMAIIIYSGFMIPEPAMKRWLVWIYYINPVSYAFAAVMGNEFGRLSLICAGDSVIPNGPDYPTTLGLNQVCTLRGASPGSLTVSGEDYISASYTYSKENVWRNLGIEMSYFALFSFCLYVAVESLSLGSGMPTINVFAKANAERQRLNERLQARKQDFRTGKAEQDLTRLIQTRKPFTWEALTYVVNAPGGKKRLLNEIYGYVKPGTLTALMGSSGAGKTTLLDVLANRKTTGVITGEMYIAGRAPGPEFQRGTAYCEQQDVHEWTATVREAFRFSAYLRQPAHISIEEKDAYVEEVIQLLEMEDLADAMIGIPGVGLGVEARKRVTIGVELAAKPQLLLFLDEPTSGLDGQSAYNIVRFLKKLALAGQAVLCTIHQPNALLFENFDRLLLLKGGRCVYFGDIGHDSHVLRSYFEKQGARCPEDANPAEFMLEAIGAGTARQAGGDADWADRWLESEEHAENIREVQRMKEESLSKTEEEPSAIATSYAQTFGFQLKIVFQRANLSFYRNADNQLTRLFNHISIALLAGLTFLNLGNSAAELQFRIFSILIAGIIPALIIAQVEPTFIMARMIFTREASSKSYSELVFAISQFLAEMPYSTICAVSYYLLWYFCTGFNTSSSRAGYAFLMIWILEVFAVTLGQAIAALSPSIYIASQANPPIVVTLCVFCGVIISQDAMPKFWRQWIYDLNPYTRLIAGLLVNELHDLPVICQPQEFLRIQPPSGQTCSQWLSPFVSSAGGYIRNPNATENCDYCQYSTGDEFLMKLNYSWGNRWRDLGIFIAYCAFHFCVTIVASKFLTRKYSKR